MWLMGYQPRTKPQRGTIHEYKKPLHEKSKNKKSIRRRTGEPVQEEKQPATLREVSEGTLKRLHTLGSQKFGSFPFSEHFDRWLANVAVVLGEFESHPNIIVDDQYVRERTHALAAIKLQLEGRRRKEASINKELKNLSEQKAQLGGINTEYANINKKMNSQKSRELKHLYNEIERLKKDQDIVIKIKTGFFRGISKKEREQKEIEIAEQLSEKQRELELFMLHCNAAQKQLRDEYDRKREPVFKQINYFQKAVEDLETDGSLEQRWLACEAIIDALNNLLQRNAQLHSDTLGT